MKIDFCYACGGLFSAENPATDDHVPPKRIFKQRDRELNPYQVPAHRHCNNAYSVDDQIITQLVSLVHKDHRNRTQLKQRVSVFRDRSGRRFGGISDLPLRPIIWRWIRAFHSGLYDEQIDGGIPGTILEPFPAFDQRGSELIERPILRQFEALIAAFKKNRAAGRLDEIYAYGGKCHYACVWETFDNGVPFCLFALDVYDWASLGSQSSPKRGCVGAYLSNRPVPAGASRGVVIDIPYSNCEPLKPFE